MTVISMQGKNEESFCFGFWLISLLISFVKLKEKREQQEVRQHLHVRFSLSNIVFRAILLPLTSDCRKAKFFNRLLFSC